MVGMVKTPDEIKKGLKLCGRGCYPGCPYKSFECVEELSRDGLEYIQQLEARIDTLTAKAVLFDESVAAGEKLKCERDAAIKTLKEIGDCKYCKHDCVCTIMFPNCVECEKTDCACHTCVYRSNWQWRGVEVE